METPTNNIFLCVQICPKKKIHNIRSMTFKRDIYILHHLLESLRTGIVDFFLLLLYMYIDFKYIVYVCIERDYVGQSKDVKFFITPSAY